MTITLETMAPRPVAHAITRGCQLRCPACGRGKLFDRYLHVADTCADCGEELHHHRADDAPPYITILIVGHVLVAGVLALEQAYKPDSWVHAAIWVPLTLLLCLTLLPVAKGGLVGLQWALRMHGFAGKRPGAAPEAD